MRRECEWNNSPPTAGSRHFEERRERVPSPRNGVITVHDRPAQKHFPRVLESPGLKWNGYPGDWMLRLTKKTPELFVALAQIAPAGNRRRAGPRTGHAARRAHQRHRVPRRAEAGIDWFDLKVVLNVSDTTLTPEEIKLLLNARGGYVRLGKKGWRRLQFNLTPGGRRTTGPARPGRARFLRRTAALSRPATGRRRGQKVPRAGARRTYPAPRRAN